MFETNKEIKPTYKGITKYPLYKYPPTKEELDKCKFVPVRVWIFENYYAISQIGKSITVYLCRDEIPTTDIDDFNELNYYMLKDKTYPYKNEMNLEKIIKRTASRKVSNYNELENKAIKKTLKQPMKKIRYEKNKKQNLRRKQQWE